MSGSPAPTAALTGGAAPYRTRRNSVSSFVVQAPRRRTPITEHALVPHPVRRPFPVLVASMPHSPTSSTAPSTSTGIRSARCLPHAFNLRPPTPRSPFPSPFDNAIRLRRTTPSAACAKHPLRPIVINRDDSRPNGRPGHRSPVSSHQTTRHRILCFRRRFVRADTSR